MPVDGLSLLSPVTTPCRVVAQAVNYRSHARQSGFGEDPPGLCCVGWEAVTAVRLRA